MSETAFQYPTTPEDWRDCALMAHACQLIQSGKDYGLIEGGPTIKPERCQDILDKYAQVRPFQRAFTKEEISEAAVYIVQNINHEHARKDPHGS